MSLYPRTAFPSSWLDRRFAVGDTITATELSNLIRACSVLSGQRWSASIYMGSGWSFTGSSAGYFRFLIPNAGSGRQLLQGYLGATTCTSSPTAYWYTQAGSVTLGYTTSTSSSWQWPTSVANYNKTYVFNPIYASSTAAHSYRNPKNYGCGVFRIGPFTGTSPLTFGVSFCPSGSYTYNNGYVDSISSSGKTNPNIYDTPGMVLLDAGILRVCEEMLDVAETMPVVVGMLPRWTNASAGDSSITVSKLSTCRLTNMARWIPLVNLDRPRALWIAFHKTNTTNTSVTWHFNSYTGTVSDSAATNENMIYKANNDSLMAIPLSSGMFSADQNIAGMPLQFVRTSVPANADAISAWVGDAP